MLIITKKKASEEALDQIKEYLVNNGFDFHQSTGADRTIIGVIGDTHTLEEKVILNMSGVHQVMRIKPDE
ncbi:hypothetical protein SAMN02745119_02963 [Trichlorobacter thiogenes]|uniref:DAHP synthase ferredoxin-like domain-containing protein n=1 Tax=Trichlorobacter thiogenes TaxID=115783 RepID=A0A1T4RMV9_9BACT|nr:hypothetical protein [Trichlorobacter thiogenes]SKA17299.1 hypothetical protein SAMN02745119_02963 [Trichlorobacter thiogenes]